MFHDRLPARPGYAHNVESRLALLKPFRVQKELGGPDHLLLFSRLHGLERRAETIIGTGFDFDKHNDTTIQDDQIHLTRQAPVVSFDQLVSFLFKVPLRNLFPLPAEELSRISHGQRFSKREPIIHSAFLGLASRTGAKLFRWIRDGPKRRRTSRCTALL